MAGSPAARPTRDNRPGIGEPAAAGHREPAGEPPRRSTAPRISHETSEAREAREARGRAEARRPMGRGAVGDILDWDHLSGYAAAEIEDWERRRRRQRIPVLIGWLDLLSLALAFAVVVVLRTDWCHDTWLVRELDIAPAALRMLEVPLAVAFIVFWLALLRSRGLFDDDVYRDRQGVVLRITEATVIAFGVPTFLSVALGWQYLRPHVLIALPLGYLMLLFNHLVLNRPILRRMLGDVTGRQLVVVTPSQFRRRDRQEWRGPMAGLGIVAYLIVDGDEPRLCTPEGEDIVVGREALTAGVFTDLDIDQVFVMCPSTVGQEWLRRMSWTFAPMGVTVFLYPNLASANPQRVRAARIGDLAMLKVIRPGNIGANGLLKRSVDLTVALLLVLLLSPLLIGTAIAVKYGDGGPVFYRAPRVGRDGREFRMWKFRSMCVDAEAKIDKLIEAQGGSALLFKLKDDPRITPVGRFIRRYSIDELPQLFNVIGGSMSLVGPRPQVQREIAEYNRDTWMRLTVRPGITGLWQVSGRSRLTAEEAVSLDLLYIDNWSMALDISILMRTLRAVLSSDGAY